jgi:hypothetical protein
LVAGAAACGVPTMIGTPRSKLTMLFSCLVRSTRCCRVVVHRAPYRPR